MGAAAVEPDDWAIDQAVAEYGVYSASGRLSVAVEGEAADDQTQRLPFAWAGGEVQLCGAPADEAHWTVAYVPDGGEVLTPLAAGTFEVVTATWARIRDAIDPREVPPPLVRFGGDVRRHFRPAHGRFLVGVAQEGASTILLAALGEQLAVVLLEGRRRVVLDVKAPLDLREVDVERMRRFLGPGAARAAEPRVTEEARVSSATQAHHIRIIHGLPPDVPGGPSIPEVVWRCFKGLKFRAMALRCEPRDCPREQVDPAAEKPAEQVGPTAEEPAERPARRKGKRRVPARKPGKRPARLKGKKNVPRTLRALFLCSIKGSLDLVGVTSVLLRAIQKHDPSFKITLEALADVLNLLRATGTCIVTRADGERIWHIHLVGLNDASSALHRRLLEETPIPFRFPAAATNEALAEDDEAMPTTDTPTPTPSTPPTTQPSSSEVGADRRGQGGGGNDVERGKPASGGDATAAASDRSSTESGAEKATDDGAAATSSTPAPAARAASPLASLLLLSVILAAVEAAMTRLAAVTRELDELRARVAESLGPASVPDPVMVVETMNPDHTSGLDVGPDVGLDVSLVGGPAQAQQREVEVAGGPAPQDIGPARSWPGEVDVASAEQGPNGPPVLGDSGADPADGLTLAFDLPVVELSTLSCVPESEVDLLTAPDPPPPSLPPAHTYVADLVVWPTWFCAARRSIGGLHFPMPLTLEAHAGRSWFGNDFNFFATPTTSHAWALGMLGARGPPGRQC